MDQGRLELVKLNLGCGARKISGFVNVDKYGEPDLQLDLETFPWPWADSSVGEVVLLHVLEHLGGDSDTFIGIMKELYRVCAPGAIVKIVVPHPRHDNFDGDPTHVRKVTAQMLSLFDREACEEWQRGGFANTPLALYHGVNFKIRRHEKVPDQLYLVMLQEKQISVQDLARLERECFNVIAEIQIDLEVLK